MANKILRHISVTSKNLVSSISCISKLGNVWHQRYCCQLSVNPTTCLVDEPVTISAKGLDVNQAVTISAHMKDESMNDLMSFAHYRSDEMGNLDLTKNPSVGGKFEGLFPMGHLSTVSFVNPAFKTRRLSKKNSAIDDTITFHLHQGHLSEADIQSDSILSSFLHTRKWLAQGITKIPVKEGRIRGTLFIPSGNGPFPGLIDMYGSGGGLMEGRAALLASRGIATLALAYIRYDDLPAKPSSLDFSYFEEATHFLLSQPCVKKDHCAVLGTSKGCDIATLMAIHLPPVKTVVCINGVAGIGLWPMECYGKTLPSMPYRIENVKIEDNTIYPMGAMDLSKDHPELVLPIEKADAEFLFVVALDDQNWNSSAECDVSVGRLKSEGKNNYEVLKLEGAGHIMEPPYMPFNDRSYNPSFRMILFYGGKFEQHYHAEVKAWNKIIQFLKKQLNI